MKKTITVFVLLMFLISALPMVLAEETDDDTNLEETVEVQLEVENTGSTSAKPEWRTIKAKIRAKTTTECVEQLKQQYPNAELNRIRNACTIAFQASVRTARMLTAQQNANDTDNDTDDNESDETPRPMFAIRKLSATQTRKAENIMAAVGSAKAKVVENLDRARLKWCIDNQEDCKEKLQNMIVKTVKAKEVLRVREIAKDKLKQAQENFEKAKNAYQNAKNKHNKVRNEFNGLKGELAECQESGEDCTELEAEILEKAKENLISLIDRLTEHLNKVKEKVNAAENIDEEEAEEAINNLNEMIADLEDAKEDAENAEDKEAFQSAADKVRAIWKEMNYNAFRYAERVVYGQVRGIFVKSELLETKLERVLERLEDKDVDVEGMSDLLDQFKESDEYFNEAKDLRADGDEEGAKEALENAKTLARESYDSLKEAHKILMQLVREINKNGESFDPESIDEEEEIVIVEEQAAEEEGE